MELKAKENIGVSLTENMAMIPYATISGYYFAHPSAKYFSVGKIQSDQLKDYSKRKKQTIKEIVEVVSKEGKMHFPRFVIPRWVILFL